MVNNALNVYSKYSVNKLHVCSHDSGAGLSLMIVSYFLISDGIRVKQRNVFLEKRKKTKSTKLTF